MEKYEAYFSSHYPPPYGFPWDFPLPPPLSVDEFVIDIYIYICKWLLHYKKIVLQFNWFLKTFVIVFHII